MMAYPYNYGGFSPNYYSQPMPDQLTQLRQGAYQQPVSPQPINQPMQMPQVSAAPINSGILWCQGEEGAKAYMVAPNTTVLLMDSDGSSFYLKSADASGMPQPLRIFDYKERVATPKNGDLSTEQPAVDYVPREEFDALAREVEALKTKDSKSSVKKSTVKEDAENA